MKQIRLHMLVNGLLIIAAGALLVAFNSGALPTEYKRIVFSWQMLLVALGISFLFAGARKVFAGIVLLVVGGIFLLRRMDIAECYINGENIWATILVVAGIMIVLKACFLKRWRGKFQLHDPEKMRAWKEHHVRHVHEHCSRRAHRDFKHENRCSSDYIERNCVFGGSREKVESQNFCGGEVNSIFGGVVLDFTAAQLVEGVSYLEINAIFGGVELHIPSDWNIEMRQTSIFGGFIDRRAKSSFEVDDNRKLILEVNSVFGGGEIKNHA